MSAMYEVGDTVNMEAEPGKPDEVWEVVHAYRSVNGTDWVVRFKPSALFVPGYFANFAALRGAVREVKWFTKDPTHEICSNWRRVAVEVIED